MLLEIDTNPLVQERLQDKVLEIKKFLRENEFNFENFKIQEDRIQFEMSEKSHDLFKDKFFAKQNNLINPYIDQYRSHQLDLENQNNTFIIKFSKFGLLALNNAAVKQSIEIVRRRIDDLGTKEPTIIQRGEKRIVVELPGLKVPIKDKNFAWKNCKVKFSSCK